jgi:replication factor C large subunit
MQPFIRKYQPKNSSEIIGQDKAVNELKKFISGKGKSVIVYGPTGSGKTSSVYSIAEEFNLEIIEVNASDVRNKDSINSLVGSASRQMSLFGKSKIILIDEIDGLSGRKDRGGAQAIVKILEKSAFPVIMTANDPFDSKLSTLRKKSEMINFHTLNYLSIFNVLEMICKKEKINYDEQSLKTLARSAGGDMRAAINDLQIMSSNKILRKKDVDELSQRNKTQSMINALMMILKTNKLDIALRAFDEVEEDTDKRFLWMDENLPKEYTNPEDLMKAYNMMSRADVFKGRIRRWQHWHFLVYVNILLSGGIALSKDNKYKGYNKYSPTKRILKLWKAKMMNAKKKSISEKIAEKSHISIKEAEQMMPYIKQMFYDNKMAKQISEEFELDAEEIVWLKK